MDGIEYMETFIQWCMILMCVPLIGLIIVLIAGSTVYGIKDYKNQKYLQQFEADAAEREAIINSLSISDFSFECDIWSIVYDISSHNIGDYKVWRTVNERLTDDGVICEIAVDALDFMHDIEDVLIKSDSITLDLAYEKKKTVSNMYLGLDSVELTLFTLRARIKENVNVALFEYYKMPQSFVTERHNVPHIIYHIKPYGEEDYQVFVDKIKEYLRELKEPYVQPEIDTSSPVGKK